MPIVVDLTAPLGPDTLTFPTDPPFQLTWEASISEEGWRGSVLAMSPHTGTHVDAPAHFLEDGATSGKMGLDRFWGPALVVDALKGAGEDVTTRDLDGADVRAGDIVLIRTGWDAHIDTPRFYRDWPGVEASAIEMLARKGVKAVGVDSPSIDSAKALAKGAPAHRAAMSRGMPVFETLANLEKALGRVVFYGLPLRLLEAEASPIRAVAILPESR